jgi:Peptidase A4 family
LQACVGSFRTSFLDMPHVYLLSYRAMNARTEQPAAQRGVQIAALTTALVTLAVAIALGSHVRASSPVSLHAARAANVLAPSTPSSNWAGYAVTSPTSTPVNYSSVTGTWTVPTATCGPTDAGASSAVWVGIGGYSLTSQALEQTGTDADCDETGTPTYYAWYELVPSNPVNLKAKVMPGDTITTSVNILPSATGGMPTVELQVKNRTRRWTVTKKIVPSVIDTSSAEWIAEAPSTCPRFGQCVPVPLANFGTVTIGNAAAIGDGAGGTLTNPAWNVYPIELVPSSRRVHFGEFGSNGSTAGASAGAISADGRSFTVSWLADATAD